MTFYIKYCIIYLVKKLFLLFIIGISVFLSSPAVQADFSKKVTIDSVLHRRNVLIRYPDTDQRYLIYVSTGCGEFTEGQTVDLIVKGTLNYNGDQLKTDAIHKCNIQQAQPYDQQLYVVFVFSGNTEAWVTDESGQDWFMRYSSGCSAMPRYRRQHIFTVQGRKAQLADGDRLYLPQNDGRCYITHLREKRSRQTTETSTVTEDKQVPTTVTGVKANPGNKEIFLQWISAADDVGIDHYVVSYHTSRLLTDDVPITAMPNTMTSTTNSITIKNLENNTRYYFYVMAVDKSGKNSSDWSVMARGTPKASVLSDERQSSGGLTMNLKLVNESDRSFLFEWEPPAGTARQTLILEADGRREFAFTNWARTRIRILKRQFRKGKQLKLIVRSYDIYSLKLQEEITFKF